MKIACTVVGPIETNCYLLTDETSDNATAVIDPGDEAGRILDMIESGGLKPVCILLTHGHPDHVSGIPGVLEKYPDLPVYINEKDAAEAIRKGGLDQCGADKNLRYYKEGDTVDIGTIQVKVMETPGHTPGGVCLFIGNSVIFSGDTLFRSSCGRTDFPGGSMEEMLRSLARIARTDSGSDPAIYPGHGPSTTLKREYQTNYYMIKALETGHTILPSGA